MAVLYFGSRVEASGKQALQSWGSLFSHVCWNLYLVGRSGLVSFAELYDGIEE